MRHVSRGASCPSHTAAGLTGRRVRAASLRSLAGLAALGATLALSSLLCALPATAFAQKSIQGSLQESPQESPQDSRQDSASSQPSGAGALAFALPAAAATPETAAADSEDDVPTRVLNTPADVVSMNDAPLDDQVLARQRGGASGLTMVAATPDMMRGASVTLWDEIAPPAPLPVPVDAARAAQSNVASYLRK
jgi:hypothetical protein